MFSGVYMIQTWFWLHAFTYVWNCSYFYGKGVFYLYLVHNCKYLFPFLFEKVADMDFSDAISALRPHSLRLTSGVLTQVW